jgi:hypothetical protein
MLFALPDGRTIDQCGPAPVPASPSARRARNLGRKTKGTSGRSSATSSRSAKLQSRLENRLRANLAAYGSLEYDLTWKAWDMQSGPQICALRASGRRIQDSGCSGWPTPDANAMNLTGNVDTHLARVEKLKALKTNGNGAGLPLQIVAKLVGWNSPQATDGEGHGFRTDGRAKLPGQAKLAGWRSPDHNQRGGGYADPEKALARLVSGHQINLEDQAVLVNGPATKCFPSETPSLGALRPGHSRWLMGYPIAWDSCGATAMQSCRRSPRSSYAPASKP